MTAVRSIVTIAVLLAPISAAAVLLEERPPTEDELIDLPSLSPEHRDEFEDYLRLMDRHYQLEHWNSVAEEYEDRNGEQLFDAVLQGLEEVDTETRLTHRVPLHPEHDPWLFEVIQELLREDPVDWEAIASITQTLSAYVDEHPGRAALAVELLERPAPRPSDGTNALAQAIRFGGYFYLVDHWPESAGRMLAALVTLPHQPDERVILFPHPEANEDEARAYEENTASEVMSVLRRAATPEQLAEVASYIEADVEAGAFELDAETEEWLERIRQ